MGLCLGIHSQNLSQLFSSTLQDYSFCLDREYLLRYMDESIPNTFFSYQIKYKYILRTTHILEAYIEKSPLQLAQDINSIKLGCCHNLLLLFLCLLSLVQVLVLLHGEPQKLTQTNNNMARKKQRISAP